MATNKKTRTARNRRLSASIVWFDIPADNIERAKKLYGSLFGWKLNKLPAAVPEYWHIHTGGKDASPSGGLMPRMHRQQPITSFVSVASVAAASAKVEKLSGTICKPKTAVPGRGYFAIREDTEGDTFAMWKMNKKAM